jgi:hypothetical protein
MSFITANPDVNDFLKLCQFEAFVSEVPTFLAFAYHAHKTLTEQILCD